MSEIMLQQTRVETVIPYFHRFLARYPTISDLARAPLDDVLAEWSGLGYYRRARSLWHAAREVTARYGGELPAERSDLESLPGVGPYTAGAIASVAFDRQEALVDGNVARVLARLFEIGAPVDSREATAAFWALGRELVRGERPGDLNQALMELGATLCVPGRPRCTECPVADLCRGRASGNAEDLPTPKKRRASGVQELDALVVTSGAHVVLAKRPEVGLFAGLWEPPLAPRAATTERVAGSFRHVLTHLVMEVRVLVRAAAGRRRTLGPPPEPYVEQAWVHHDDVAARGGVGLSRLAKKSLEIAGFIGARAPRREKIRSA